MKTEQETIAEIADIIRHNRNENMCDLTAISAIRRVIKEYDDQPTITATLEPVNIGQMNVIDTPEHKRAE